MSWDPNVWAQIKNLTCDEIISGLEKDGWVRDARSGAQLLYYHPATRARVTIHYHPKKTYQSPKLLKNIVAEIGWSENDLRRLKLIK